MDSTISTVKIEDVQNNYNCLPRNVDINQKLFEKIVYYSSGSIGDEVST